MVKENCVKSKRIQLFIDHLKSTQFGSYDRDNSFFPFPVLVVANSKKGKLPNLAQMV